MSRLPRSPAPPQLPLGVTLASLREAKAIEASPESEAQAEVDALCPVSDADVVLLAHVRTLDQRLFRAKVALWSCGVLGLVELVHLLHH